jgi:Tfp pilus assembly protein PilV
MRSTRGFTLIETAITTLILVTAFACLANAFTYSALQTSRVLDQTVASTLASEKLEALRMTSPLLEGNNSELIPPPPGEARYLRSWRVSGRDPTRIQVIVYVRTTARGTFRELARYTALVGAKF